MFDAGAASVRHVEVVARVLGSDAAGRLDPQRWMAAEAHLASWIPDCTPHELHARGEQLLEALDADGPEPDEHPEPCVNELHLQRHRIGGGGRLVGRFDDAAIFDATPPSSTPTPHRAPPPMTAPPLNAKPRRWPTRAAGCSTTPTPPPCPPVVGGDRS